MQYCVFTYRTVEGRIIARSQIVCESKAEAIAIAGTLDEGEMTDGNCRRAVPCVVTHSVAGKAIIPFDDMRFIKSELAAF